MHNDVVEALEQDKKVYEVNPNQFGVFHVDQTPYGFVNLFIPVTEFIEKYEGLQPENIMLTDQGKASNNNLRFMVMIRREGEVDLIVGIYYPHKNHTAAKVLAAKVAGELTYTIFGGIRKASEDQSTQAV